MLRLSLIYAQRSCPERGVVCGGALGRCVGGKTGTGAPASAALVKLADKVSNLRAMLNSPPADWSEERRAKYFERAKEVVERLPAPNLILKAELDELQRRFSALWAV